MRLSEGNPLKPCANPQAHNPKLNRANCYENEMVQTYRDLNCSGASPNLGRSRYRPKGVLGKGVGNNKNASEMRQKCVKNAPKWVLFYWEKKNVPKCVRNASKIHLKRVKNAQNTFVGEHLLDDTDVLTEAESVCVCMG